MFHTITIDNYFISTTQYSVIQTDTALEFGLHLFKENEKLIKE